MLFKSRTIPSVKIRINGTIKKVIDAYRDKKVPMRVMLTDYLAVKSKYDELAAAENPWAYYYKGIKGYEIESGVSHDETLFRFSAMTLYKQKSTDVINAAFYSNAARNDYAFELGYLLPLFFENIGPSDNILVVNPSPFMVSALEESRPGGNIYYSVTDQTVADLYKLQYPDSKFCTFDQMTGIIGVDAVLITSRDQNNVQIRVLLKCLSCCNDNAVVIGLIPCVWFDNPLSGANVCLIETGFGLTELLLVDSKATVSSPKKKMVAVMKKCYLHTVALYQSSYDQKTRLFSVCEKEVNIEASSYLKSEKTILYSLKAALKAKEGKSSPKYSQAEEYRFSEEISLFYRVYSDRKNRYAGVAYYREIKDAQLKTWGRKKSSDIEKGLRASTKEGVITALEDIPFNESVYFIIRNDIYEKLVACGYILTLKTIWLYCWSYLTESKKYNHLFTAGIFRRIEIANIRPQLQTGPEMIQAIAKGLRVNVDELSYSTIEQLDLILKAAVKHGLLKYDPLELLVAEYTNRATERQQDVRNALVKKHFSSDEEMNIFREIVRKQTVNGIERFSCTYKSLLLAAAIRMFTGMAIREVAALNWGDFRPLEGIDDFQFTITKFVDSRGKIQLHSARENWKRFRIVPSARILSHLLNDRKQYLLESGISPVFLTECPIVLAEENLHGMKAEKTVNYCKPDKISSICGELIKAANISENEIVLPDAKSDMITDFNCYHGDIFLSNFRHKANHAANMTIGEINYMTGIDAPDTLSRHYCDYTNDFVQAGMIQKLSRWEFDYEKLIKEEEYPEPAFGTAENLMSFETGPFQHGVAAVDLMIINEKNSNTKIIVTSAHGVDINNTVY